jgi:hypothetical protein
MSDFQWVEAPGSGGRGLSLTGLMASITRSGTLNLADAAVRLLPDVSSPAFVVVGWDPKTRELGIRLAKPSEHGYRMVRVQQGKGNGVVRWRATVSAALEQLGIGVSEWEKVPVQLVGPVLVLGPFEKLLRVNAKRVPEVRP